MSKRSDRDFLGDIQEALRRIAEYTEGVKYLNFVEDTKTQDAVVRNLEIIGEAVKNLSAALREKYSHVPWREMAGVRDRLIHRYFGVNLEIVWQIVVDDLPKVAAQIEAILNDDDGG